MTVAAILALKGRNVVTTTPDATVAEAARLMEAHEIGAIVILRNGGTVAGIFSERDMVRALAREGQGAMDRPVAAFMTQNVVTSSPEDSIADLMHRMTEGKFRHLPVMEDGTLAGIVSIGDVVKQRIAEAEAEAQAMREYIATA